jgi:hypothetical protein
MDKVLSIKNLCGEMLMDMISPSKYTYVGDIIEDSAIETNLERGAKCIALGTGNLIINIMMMKIEICRNVSYYAYNQFNHLQESINNRYYVNNSGNEDIEYHEDNDIKKNN